MALLDSARAGSQQIFFPFFAFVFVSIYESKGPKTLGYGSERSLFMAWLNSVILIFPIRELLASVDVYPHFFNYLFILFPKSPPLLSNFSDVSSFVLGKSPQVSAGPVFEYRLYRKLSSCHPTRVADVRSIDLFRVPIRQMS